MSFVETKLFVLGHVVTREGIGPDPEKIEAVVNFPACDEGKSLKEQVKREQSFLGLCFYYRRHIYRFAMLAQPLTLLTKKNMPFIWQSEQQESFTALKTALGLAPVFAHPDYNLPMEIIPDACGYGIGGC